MLFGMLLFAQIFSKKMFVSIISLKEIVGSKFVADFHQRGHILSPLCASKMKFASQQFIRY